ncbi:hypothetical protein D3C84_69790 [compost metagenome]
MMESGEEGKDNWGNARMLVNEHDLRQVTAGHEQILMSEALSQQLNESGCTPIKMTPERAMGLLHCGSVLRSEGFARALQRADQALQASKAVTADLLGQLGRSGEVVVLDGHNPDEDGVEVVMHFAEEEDGVFVITYE